MFKLIGQVMMAFVVSVAKDFFQMLVYRAVMAVERWAEDYLAKNGEKPASMLKKQMVLDKIGKALVNSPLLDVLQMDDEDVDDAIEAAVQSLPRKLTAVLSETRQRAKNGQFAKQPTTTE